MLICQLIAQTFDISSIGFAIVVAVPGQCFLNGDHAGREIFNPKATPSRTDFMVFWMPRTKPCNTTIMERRLRLRQATDRLSFSS